MIEELGDFMSDKGTFKNKEIEPFDESKLVLVTVDFIS